MGYHLERSCDGSHLRGRFQLGIFPPKRQPRGMDWKSSRPRDSLLQPVSRSLDLTVPFHRFRD